MYLTLLDSKSFLMENEEGKLRAGWICHLPKVTNASIYGWEQKLDTGSVI